MRVAAIETLCMSHMGLYGTFETSAPGCLDPNVTISVAFLCLQLARARHYGMRAGAVD